MIYGAHPLEGENTQMAYGQALDHVKRLLEKELARMRNGELTNPDCGFMGYVYALNVTVPTVYHSGVLYTDQVEDWYRDYTAWLATAKKKIPAKHREAYLAMVEDQFAQLRANSRPVPRDIWQSWEHDPPQEPELVGDDDGGPVRTAASEPPAPPARREVTTKTDPYAPFRLVGDDSYDALLLTDDHMLARVHVFEERADAGWNGSGYDWSSVARVLVAEQFPQHEETLSFDPEAGMMAIYGPRDALLDLAPALKRVYADESLLRDLLTRAELD